MCDSQPKNAFQQGILSSSAQKAQDVRPLSQRADVKSSIWHRTRYLRIRSTGRCRGTGCEHAAQDGRESESLWRRLLRFPGSARTLCHAPRRGVRGTRSRRACVFCANGCALGTSPKVARHVAAVGPFQYKRCDRARRRWRTANGMTAHGTDVSANFPHAQACAC